MHIDSSRLEELADIMGDELGSLVVAYLESAAELVDQAHSAYQDADYVQLRQAAHSLKGASMNIGAQTLSEYCRALEDACNADAQAPSTEQLAMIRREFASVADHLDEYTRH